MIRGPICHFFSSFVFFVFIVCIGAAGQMPAQNAPAPPFSMVTFHVNAHHAPVPMKVVRVMLGDQEIPLDTPVPVEGMWMRTISVTLQNISSKTIFKCGISVMFPETFAAANGPVPSITMSMGKHPKHALMQRDGTVRTLNHPETEIQILPGSSVTFKAPEGADWDQAEAYKIVNSLSKVNIVMDLIYFSDESRWISGMYYIAVPPPALWQEISPEDFFAAAPPAQQ